MRFHDIQECEHEKLGFALYFILKILLLFVLFSTTVDSRRKDKYIFHLKTKNKVQIVTKGL